MNFETKTKTKDREALFLAIAEFIFVGTFIGIDLFYSSLSLMPTWLLCIVWAAKIIVAIFVIMSWVHFKDPNYDKYRWATIIVAIALSFTIGIHHASEKENNQVQIDSKENAAKP